MIVSRAAAHKNVVLPATSVTSSSAPIAPGDLLDEIEVAEVLKIARATLRNWRALKQGPRYVKLGKRAVRYRRVDLEAFVYTAAHAEGGAP